MKNLFFLIAGAIIIMLSACGKSEVKLTQQNQSDTISSKINLIIGKWYYTTDTVNYYNNAKLDSTKVLNYFQTDNIVFNSNGTGTETRSGVNYNFTFSVISPNINLVFSSQPVIQNVKIQTDGMGSFVSTNYGVIAAIKQLSDTKMKLVFQTTKGTAVTDETVYFVKQ